MRRLVRDHYKLIQKLQYTKLVKLEHQKHVSQTGDEIFQFT